MYDRDPMAPNQHNNPNPQIISAQPRQTALGPLTNTPLQYRTLPPPQYTRGVQQEAEGHGGHHEPKEGQQQAFNCHWLRFPIRQSWLRVIEQAFQSAAGLGRNTMFLSPS